MHGLEASLLRLFVGLCLFCIIIIPTTTSASPENIFRDNKKTVVSIYSYDDNSDNAKQGSGFFIRSDGLVATNYHVIADSTSIKIIGDSETFNVTSIVHIDMVNDIAILKVNSENHISVKIGNVSEIKTGEEVYVISSPMGLDYTISNGILSSIRDISKNRKLIQITAAVSQGSSGSPVFNKRGEVIGIVTFLIDGAQNLNFAVPIQYADVRSIRMTPFDEREQSKYEKMPEYWFNIGVKYYEIGDYEKSLNAFNKSINLDPDNFMTYSKIGLIYFKTEHYPKAIEYFELSQMRNPKYYASAVLLGVSYSRVGNHKKAIKAFEVALTTYPNDFETLQRIAASHLAIGNYNETEAYLKKALLNNSDSYDAEHLLGVTYSIQGKHVDSIKHLKKAIMLDPDKIDSQKLLVMEYLSAKEADKAVEEYIAMKKINPKAAGELLKLIIISKSLVTDPNYVSIIEEDVKNAKDYIKKGYEAYQVGNYDDAVELFMKSLSLLDGNESVYILIGITHMQRKDFNKAVNYFQEAIRLNNSNPESHFYLGTAYVFLAEHEMALKEHAILKSLDKEKAFELENIIFK